MKKIIASLLITIVFCIHTANAQVDSLRQALDYIFAHVDKTEIPNGYLSEYSSDWVNNDHSPPNSNPDLLHFSIIFYKNKKH